MVQQIILDAGKVKEFTNKSNFIYIFFFLELRDFKCAEEGRQC